MKSYGVPGRCRASAGAGGKDILMLDNALAMVDNFVSMKLGL
ncbi:MAG: hypothetical protein ACI3XJ_06895 [Oscillospiraceae bacterium]